MAFTALTSAACAAGKAVTTTLMNLIRTNFDDHESRLAVVEAATIETGFMVGEIRIWTTNTLPTGWLFCDGSTVSRTVTYDDLFAVIGTTYGAGDGSTTYALPDLRGRAPFGKDDMNNSVGSGGGAASRLTSAGSSVDGATLGATGGAQNVTLTGAQSGTSVHNHGTTGAEGSHTHNIQTATITGVPGGNDPTYLAPHQGGGTGMGDHTSKAGSSHTHSVGNSSAADASSAHTNMPPALVINYIIRYLA